MRSKRPSFFWLSALVGVMALACSGRHAEDYGSHLLRTPGTFACFDGALKVEISEASEGRIQYRVSTSKGSFGPAQPALQRDRPWAIFSESATRVWIDDGGKDLSLIELMGENGAKFTSSQVLPDLVKEAPAEVRQGFESRAAEGK